MNVPSFRNELSSRIARAVQSIYEQAGFDPSEPSPGIAPLYDLIGAYPIRVTELSDLTYQRAAAFLVAEVGQAIPVPSDQDRPLAGFLYIYEYAEVFYGCILVKKNDPVTRRRFSAAHELGHYVLHFVPLLERQQDMVPEVLILTEGLTYADEPEVITDIPSGQLTFARGVGSSPLTVMDDVKQMEREANQFAAELLMPTSTCLRLVERYSPRLGNRRPVLSRRLATEFLVSREAVKWRLTNLGLPAGSADSDTNQP